MSQRHKYLPQKRLPQKRLLATKLSMRGLTLLEVITVVSIISILAGLLVPNMEHFVVKMRVDNEISRLQRLLLLTRNAAINNYSNTILCPLDESGQCSTLWHKELSVFIDFNNNRRFDPDNNELIIRSKAAIKKNDILIYGKKRKSITFHPTGRLSGLSNGTFRYCPRHHESKSRGIVIARSGRVYTTSDIDNDSKDETRMNKEVTCD